MDNDKIKCPACGNLMQKSTTAYGFYVCINPECDLYYHTFRSCFIKRMTIAPKPLTCPACGGYVAAGEHDGGMKVVCFNDCCGIQGPFRKTQREAEDAFRWLSYRKD